MLLRCSNYQWNVVSLVHKAICSKQRPAWQLQIDVVVEYAVAVVRDYIDVKFFLQSRTKILCPWKISVFFNKCADFDTTVLWNAKVNMFLPLFSIQILGSFSKGKVVQEICLDASQYTSHNPFPPWGQIYQHLLHLKFSMLFWNKVFGSNALKYFCWHSLEKSQPE